MCCDTGMSSTAPALNIQCNRTPMNLEISDLCFTPPDQKGGRKTCLLQNVTGQFRAGRLCAILGPSGAGKSSFLNVLSGFKINGVTGSISINGVDRLKQDFQRLSAYIPQEFAMLCQLTIRETLMTSANLKLGPNVAQAMKSKIVSDIIDTLNLSKCSDTKVAALSGGEKKRLSMGVELVTNPPIMMFDEPTSGLDSSSAFQVVSLLRNLAHSGRTIICVLHQPTSRLLDLIDDIFLMSDGKCIYNGSLDNVVSTLSSAGFVCPPYYNRADFALEVASHDRVEGSIEKLLEKQQYHPISVCVKDDMNNSVADSVSSGLNRSPSDQTGATIVPLLTAEKPPPTVDAARYAISQWQQFIVLLKRSLLCTFRDFHFAQMRLICHILIGLLLGIVFYNIGNDASKVVSNISCLFFFLMFIFFANSMPTVLTFPCEAAVFTREHLNSWYSVEAYYLSKLIADIPLQVLCPTCFIATAYFMTDQPPDCERLAMLWTICFLNAILAQSLGLFAGAAFDMQLGIFLVPASCIPMLIFSGFFIRFGDLSDILKPLTYFSYFRYGYEGSMLAIYGNGRELLHCGEPYCPLQQPKKILDYVGMTSSSFTFDIIMLIGWIVFLQAMLYTALRVRLNHAK